MYQLVSHGLLAFSFLFTLAYCDFQLQILHNNDLHARFAETDVYCGSCPEDYVLQNKCYGGFARMKEAAKNATADAKKQNISTIFLNAGDTFQGTPYYTLYKWEVAAALIDKMQFDVMALGNHEFDDGIDNLVKYLTNITTPVIAANLNISSEPRLNLPILTASKILTVDGRKIGVVGYITPDTQHISDTEDLEIFDEIPYIRAEARRLRNNGIRIIIALGHSGFDKDVQIATEIEEISVVVGGHSHSLLYSPRDKPPSVETPRETYPYMVTQNSGKQVPVVQAYAYSKYLGKLQVVFDDNGNVISATGNPQILDGRFAKDPELDAAVSVWKKKVDKIVNIVSGHTRVFLSKPDFNNGVLESNLANLITDSFVDAGVGAAFNSSKTEWTNAPVAFYQNGGIRSIIDNKKNNGAVTYGDLMTLLPFGNKLVEVDLYGRTIKKALEYSVSTYDEEKDDHYFKYYMHFSGMRVSYDFKKPVNERVESLTILCSTCDIPKYEPLEDDKVYTVIMPTFLAKGGDNFQMIEDENLGIKLLGTVSDLDALVSYIEKSQIIYSKLDNRTVVKGFTPVSYSSSKKFIPSVVLLWVLAIVKFYL